MVRGQSLFEIKRRVAFQSLSKSYFGGFGWWRFHTLGARLASALLLTTVHFCNRRKSRSLIDLIYDWKVEFWLFNRRQASFVLSFEEFPSMRCVLLFQLTQQSLSSIWSVSMSHSTTSPSRSMGGPSLSGMADKSLTHYINRGSVELDDFHLTYLPFGSTSNCRWAVRIRYSTCI